MGASMLSRLIRMFCACTHRAAAAAAAAAQVACAGVRGACCEHIPPHQPFEMPQLVSAELSRFIES